MKRLFLSLAVVSLGCLIILSDLHGQNAPNFVSRGNAWFEKGDFDKAIAEYSEALRYNPKSASVYYSRGLAWNNKGDYDKSLVDYTQALTLEPKNANAYNGRGLTYYRKGDYDKAIADFTQALAVDPKDKYANNNRGNAWREKGNYDKAVVDFNQALTIDPKDRYANYNRGLTWNKKGEYEKAIADYTQALAINPKNVNAWNQLGWMNATCPDVKYRDGKKAYENANKAYILDGGKSGNSIDTLAAAYAESGDFEKAKEWEAKAIALTTVEKDKSLFLAHLEVYKQGKPYRQEAEKK